VLLVLALAALSSGCRDTATTSSSPQPAASVAFVAGTTFAPDTPSVSDGRVVIAYVRDSAGKAEVRRLADRIASLPEVERYAFMDKDAMLEFFRKRFGESAAEPVPLPQGFWLLLREPKQAASVAAALAEDPALKHDGSRFSGVKPARELYEWLSAPE
jgi:cell division protein FtsX